MKILFFKGCRYNILTPNKISSIEKYKYLILYLDDFENKPFSLILRKTSTYVKSYGGESKRMYFPSVIVLKKNLLANPSTMKISENQNKISFTIITWLILNLLKIVNKV